MNKVVFVSLLCCMFVSCSNVEKKAAVKLSEAQAAFESGNYNEAKLLIDSIKILYPKAFDTRRAGIKLMQQVELKEQQKTVAYLDSVLAAKQQAVEDILKDYKFEKDEEYQTIGNYFHPTQVVERTLHRSFLRFQADERGKLSMTSVYCGGSFIHHHAVRVTAPDGSFAETPHSKDIYETTDLAEKIEKADYKIGEDGGVIRFICQNQDKNLKVQYIGERNYAYTMAASDKQAAVSIYKLADLLSAITEINKEKEEANLKIRFVNKKMEGAKEGSPIRKAETTEEVVPE